MSKKAGLMLLIVATISCGVFYTSSTEAQPSIVWKSPPKTLVRGRHFVWQGKLEGLSPSLLRQGVFISFRLIQQQRNIRLGHVPVNAQGQFVLEGVVSYQLSPSRYRLDVRILTPQQARKQSTQRDIHIRSGQRSRQRGDSRDPRHASLSLRAGTRTTPGDPKGTAGGTARRSQPAPKKPAPKAGKEPDGQGDNTDDQNSQDLPSDDNAPRPSRRRGTSEKPAGRDTSTSPAPTDKPAVKPSGAKDLAQEIQKRTQKLLKKLQKGWTSTRQGAQGDSLFLSQEKEKSSFLLPPIAPDQNLQQRMNSRTRQKQPTTPQSPQGQSPPGKNPQGKSPAGQSPQGQSPSQRSSPAADRERPNVRRPEPGSQNNGRQPGKDRRHLSGIRGQQDRLDASRISGDTPRRNRAGRASSGQGSSDFQVRSRGSRDGTGQRQQGSTGGDPESQEPDPQGDRDASDQQGSGQGTTRQGSSGDRADASRGTRSGPGRQPQSDDKEPLMVPPVDPSLHPRARRKNPPVHSHRDSLIWNRAQTSQLDTRTGMGHTYLRQVFDPYIPHLQRISVFSKVSPQFRLYQEETKRRRVEVGGRRSANRSYFVGRIRVVLWRHRWTPIPSVSPEARILWYQTRPPVQLEFARDGGDLMYVRARRWKASIIHLTFGTDGARSYFGGTVPEGISAARYPLALRPYVPYRVRYVALRRLKRFGVSLNMELDDVLRRVIPYLRGFVARKLKPWEHKRNPFDTLWRARVGVCRHRAMLFTIALQSLGFPARMVANRAHAFAEVQYPNGQWRQVDLGGGEIPHWMGQWRGRKYQPPEDPFPRPPPSARRQRMPTTPHPPPHAPDPQEQRQGGVRASSGRPGTARNGQPGQGSPGQGTGSGKLLRTRVRQRKKRQPYVPHTKF